MEPDDPSRESALLREVLEEWGARIVVGPQVLLTSAQNGDALDIQHFFLLAGATPPRDEPVRQTNSLLTNRRTRPQKVDRRN